MSLNPIAMLLMVLLIVVPGTSKSDSWTDLEGTTKDGWKVFVSGECCKEGESVEGYRSMDVYLRRHGADGKYREIQFYDEMCEMAYDRNKHGKIFNLFRCKANGKSPLAGVSYESVPFPPHTGHCDTVFHCKSGCTSNAPLKLIQPGVDCG